MGWEAEAWGEGEEHIAVRVEGGEEGVDFVVVRLDADDADVGRSGD